MIKRIGVVGTIVSILTILTMIASAAWVSAQTGATRVCEVLATLRIDALTVVNVEEARGQSDFGAPGDEVTLSYALGPLDAATGVDYGTLDEHLARWSGDLEFNQRVDAIGSLARHVCADDFGVLFWLVEDDSTPFGAILTRLGAPMVIGLFQGDQIIRQPGSYVVNITGVTQDGNFDYQIDYSITYEDQPIRQIDLTPTVSPSPTFTASPSATPSPTLTATVTRTPSPTETHTPTYTVTPSRTLKPTTTPTPTYTPTITRTPSSTPTPTHTPTIDLGATAAALIIQQTEFAILVQQQQLVQTQDAFIVLQTQFAVMQTQTYAALFPSATPTASHTPTFTATYTPSPTATYTPTFTATFTASNTATYTATPSDTPTVTPTYTPSQTYTPSITPTASDTPLPSATPTVTGTPTPLQCAGTLPSRLYPGLRGRVTAGGVPNRVRRTPGLSGGQFDELPSLSEFVVTDGPRCVDAYVWYEVNGNGWTAEASSSAYFIEPIRVIVPLAARCFVSANETIRKRAMPSTAAEVVGRLERGENPFVVGQQVGGDGFTWWNLEDGAWVREDTVNESDDSTCNAVPVTP
ncbi:MAG: hypothetical protein SGJ24_09695 [Chloroflexota bacterium]|nr:hypothetical protein [Chloroflexota bacterium]